MPDERGVHGIRERYEEIGGIHDAAHASLLLAGHTQAFRPVLASDGFDVSVRGVAFVRQPVRYEPDRGQGERRSCFFRRGIFSIRAVYRGAYRHQRVRPGGKQAAGLRHVQAADCRIVRSCHDELRRPVQSIHELSFQPFRRHACQSDDEVHERVPAFA